MTLLAPKTEFMHRLTRLTGTPLPEVRQRIRVLYDYGIGPLRAEPLSDSTLALYLIGFLASHTHLGAAEVAEQFGGFGLVVPLVDPGAVPNATGARSDRFRASTAALGKIFPDLITLPARGILACVVRALAENKPLQLIELHAALPPYDKFRIRLQPNVGGVPVDLVYEPGFIARKLRQKEGSFPMKIERTMPGGLVAKLVDLATPDEILSRRRASEQLDDAGDAQLHTSSPRYTPAQAGDRIRELRKGHALSEGETIRSVIAADKR